MRSTGELSLTLTRAHARDRPLVPKLQLGNAIGLRSFASGAGPIGKRRPAKQSFEDKGIPKLELGNEGTRGRRIDHEQEREHDYEVEAAATRFYPGLRGNFEGERRMRWPRTYRGPGHLETERSTQARLSAATRGFCSRRRPAGPAPGRVASRAGQEPA